MSRTDREKKVNREQANTELKKKMIKPSKTMGAYVKEYLVLMAVLFFPLVGVTILLWDYPLWQCIAIVGVILVGWLIWLKIREKLEMRAEKVRKMRTKQRELLKKAKDKTDGSINPDYVSTVKKAKTQTEAEVIEEDKE